MKHACAQPPLQHTRGASCPAYTVRAWKLQQHSGMVDTGLNSLYRLFNCCWYSWQGPRWIGRRGNAGGGGEGKGGDGAGDGGQVMEAAQVSGVQLCRPRELMPESCAGHAGNHATASSSLDTDHAIRYETLGEEHVEEVMQLLVHSFFREEPLGLAAGVHTPEDVRRWLPTFVRPLAREAVSSVAVEAESGRVVGVALCHIPEHSGGGEHDSPLMAALDPARDGKMMAVAQFLADLHIGIQDEPGWLSLLVLNVERHFSGRGIAAELVKRSEEKARARGMSAVTADTTGEFSRTTFARLGYETLRELKYDEYAGAALRSGPVHTTARVMLKRL